MTNKSSPLGGFNVLAECQPLEGLDKKKLRLLCQCHPGLTVSASKCHLISSSFIWNALVSSVASLKNWISTLALCLTCCVDSARLSFCQAYVKFRWNSTWGTFPEIKRTFSSYLREILALIRGHCLPVLCFNLKTKGFEVKQIWIWILAS